jgi:uncharacterized protein (DUF305 family)
MSRVLYPVLLLSLAATSGACRTARADGPPLVQPGAPGSPSRLVTAAEAAAAPGASFSEADVRFMQGMIVHHAQALEMSALVPSRSDADEIRLLARRIEISQADEIRSMRRWLEVRGADAPGGHAHHEHAPAGMHGMASADEMRRLEQARGAAFDRLFLELMIAHHEGALVMVEDLLSAEGAAQDPEVFAFASDVEADQQMEIARMRRMLAGRR